MGQPLLKEQVADRNAPRALAVAVLEELRLIDSAVDQWAIENNKRAGAQPTAKDIAAYLKLGTRLYTSWSSGSPTDYLGNPIKIPAVDGPIKFSRKTFDQLSSVASLDFWSPYGVE